MLQIYRGLKIGKKIALGFALVTLVLIGVVFITLKQVEKTNIISTQVMNLRIPTARASLMMLNGINHSLAALRGWMLLGKDKFKVERAKAWSDEIVPSLKAMREYSKNWTNPKNQERLKVVEMKLNDFKKFQIEIENIAQTLDNLPANKILFQDAEPLAAILMDHITQIIDLEAKLEATPRRKAMLGMMADIRGTTASSLANIRAYLLSGDRKFKDKFDVMWTKNIKRFGDLTAKSRYLTPKQQALFREFTDKRAAFTHFPQQMFEIRSGSEWNLANSWLKIKAAPTAFLIKEQLADMNTNQNKLLQADLHLSEELIENLNKTLWVLLFVAVVISGVLGFVITRSITDPISQLILLAQQIAKGNFRPVSSSSSSSSSTETDELKLAMEKMGQELFDVSESELLQAKEDAEEDKTRLDAVMDNLIDGLIIIDSKGSIQSINSAVVDQFGYNSSEVLGKNIKMLMPDPDHSQHDQYLKNYLTTGNAKIIGLGREVTGLRKDGSTFPIDLGVSQLDTPEGTSFIGTLRDITERKQSEHELLQAKEDAEEANRAKSMFLANMSHEIRTPMNAVLGYSQILLRNKSLDKETLDSIRTIDNSGKNLLKMINEILDISKIEAGKMELNLSDFDLNVLIFNINSMFDLRCKQKQLKWSIEVPSTTVIVRADEVKLRQILINLLGNAVKFTDKGEVSLSVTALENNQYRFDIKDTGNGISMEEQEKVFDAFQQDEEGAKKGGTGLGLAISKKQLELMGSELHLDSKVNEGSNFYFTLNLPPVDREHYIDRRGRHRNVLHLKPECKVMALVVDDVKENRDVLAKLLTSIGVEVLEAINGKEAVEKTIEYKPDIVFMDMRMPVMRGEEAVELIVKECGKDRIKIVTITASALDRRREYYLDLGCHEFISKPFTAEQIYECLEVLLHVEYVCDEDEHPQEESPLNQELDISQLSIPQDLYEKIKESADQYNITFLEKALEELQQRDEVSDQLYEHLKALSKSYDMEAIIKVLESIPKINN